MDKKKLLNKSGPLNYSRHQIPPPKQRPNVEEERTSLTFNLLEKGLADFSLPLLDESCTTANVEENIKKDLKVFLLEKDFSDFSPPLPSKSIAPTQDIANLRKALKALHQELLDDLRAIQKGDEFKSNTLLEVTSYFFALIDILSEKGVIDIDEVDKHAKQHHNRLSGQFSDQTKIVTIRGSEQDRTKEEVRIDCESRIHLCKAACCRMPFALSKEEILEGVIKSDVDMPYKIAQGKDGYCYHLDRNFFQCQCHRQRPVPCRVYDCRENKLIWDNFEEKRVSSKLEELF